MKLRDFSPQLSRISEQEQRLNNLTGLLSLFHQQQINSSSTYQTPSLGLDNIVNVWLRHQMAYRQQMVIDLQTIALTVEEVRAPIHHIASEVFRKGIQWKPKFAVKCETCNVEYADLIESCQKCKSSDHLRLPDESQRHQLDNFIKDSNIWDNSLEDVLRKFHFDVNTVDDGFIYLAKEYYGSDDITEPVRSKVMEVRNLHPSLVEFDLDTKGLPKNSHWLCYIHRDTEPNVAPGVCLECGRELIPAMYKYYHRGKLMYLLPSEVIHESKFLKTETYGWSPILTIFEKVLTIMGMDKNIYRYFHERKMPASMIMVFTDDPESLRRERADMAAKLKLDPNYVPMVAVSAKQGRGRMDMVRLFHTLQEMDYLPVRQEIRERIAAMWGVTPAWQGSPEAFGGLSMQTQQLTVMSRVVEGDQRMFHEKVFPRILNAFGITDWVLELPQPEEKAEATRIMQAQQKISAASMLLQMGFDIKAKSKDVGIMDIDFTISGEAKKPEMPSPFGGLGGIPSTGAEEENPATGINTMEKAEGVASQLIKAGYAYPNIKKVSDDFSKVWFIDKNQHYIANFSNGQLSNVEKATWPKMNMHVHGNYPPHDANMKHVEREQPRENTIYDAEEPEEPI